jgi:hypothetical protein
MGSTPAPPVTPPATTAGDMAERFFNALANDQLPAAFGGGTSDTLGNLIRGFFRNDDGDIEFTAETRQAAADRLIASFSAIANKPLPQDMRDLITNTFTDAGVTSPEDLARKIKDQEFMTLWLRMTAENEMNFGDILYDQSADFLWEHAPWLMNLLISTGLLDDPNENVSELNIKNELAEGWEAWQNGRVGQFNEISAVDAQGQPIPQDQLGQWRTPGNRPEINEFFEVGGSTNGSRNLWGSDEEFRFTDAEAEGRPNTFEGMIMRKWEADGIIEFTGTDEEKAAARQAWLQQSHAFAVGGQLDEGFAQSFVDQGIITFPDAAAQQAFTDHMSQFDGRNYDAERIMGEVIRYMQDTPNGASWTNPRFDDETESQYSTTQSQVLRLARMYEHVPDGHDYAERMLQFASRHPNITLAAPEAEEEPGGPSAEDADPNAEPEEPAEDPNAIRVAQFDATEEAGYLDYGNAITGDFDASTMAFTSNDGTEVFKFSDDFQIFGVDLATERSAGAVTTSFNMNALDMQGKSPQEILAELGDDFKVSVVAYQDEGSEVENSELLGFYVESVDGSTSFYIGPSAIEEGTLTDAGKAVIVEGIEQAPNAADDDYDPSTDPNLTAPPRDIGNATVDGQDNNHTIFQP